MKSFKQFNEDAYAGRQGAGAWLTSKALELGARGITPPDVKKDMEAPNLKKAPTKKDIKDIAKDNIRTRGSEAVKGQLADRIRNQPRDQRIKEVIKNTKPGTMERARGLLGIPRAKVLPDPPKYKGK